MKRKMRWIALLLVLCMTVGLAPAALAADAADTNAGEQAPFGTLVRSFTASGDTVNVYEDTQTLAGGTLSLRGWTLAEGDLCVMGAWQTEKSAAGGQVLWQTETSCKALTIRYYDGTQWIVDDLKEGIYAGGTAFFISGEDWSMMCYVPLGWKLLENGSRRLTGQGRIETEKTENGWVIRLCAPALESGSTADFTCLTSQTALVGWDKANTENLWRTYCNNGSGRWCYDGYYYISPTTYEPTGEDVYYRLPAAYLCKSFAYQTVAARAAWDLAICMLDVLLLQQNDYGYFPTQSLSQWLSSSYGIGTGFYDTRFNSDLMEIVVYMYNRHHSESYLEAMEQYCAFYAAHAEEYHVETASGGWLVADYWGEGMTSVPHTSLNHQLAEMKVLYEMADILERDDLTALADKLLLAVQDTGLNWVNENGDLHYSVSTSGIYSGNDYPYLTYNDLYNMQALLKKRTGEEDPTLAALMEAKKQWMDANGVTGYYQ